MASMAAVREQELGVFLFVLFGVFAGRLCFDFFSWVFLKRLCLRVLL